MLSQIPPDWIVLTAGGAFILGYLIINQVILRLMVALGTFLYIWYYYVAIEDPRAAVLTSVLMGTANFIGLAQIWYRNSKWVVPRAFRDIYPRFSTLPPGDFRALMKTADRTILPVGQQITVQNKPNSHLYFLLSGGIRAEKSGEKFNMPAGIFVGEVAYMIQGAASASTIVTQESEVLRWDISTLLQKSKKNARFRLALEALISNDLARKVSVSVAPKRMRIAKPTQGHVLQSAP